MVFEMVTPEAFNPVRSGELLLFTVLAGSRHWAGALLGGALTVLAHTTLPLWTPASGLYLGLLFMVLVVRAPEGLTGLAVQSWVWGRGPGLALSWPKPMAWVQGVAVLGTLYFAGGLVEMSYQYQQLSTQGPVMHWPGLTINLDQPLHWMGMALSAMICVGGWAIVWGCHRHMKKEAQT